MIMDEWWSKLSRCLIDVGFRRSGGDEGVGVVNLVMVLRLISVAFGIGRGKIYR